MCIFCARRTELRTHDECPCTWDMRELCLLYVALECCQFEFFFIVSLWTRDISVRCHSPGCWFSLQNYHAWCNQNGERENKIEEFIFGTTFYCIYWIRFRYLNNINRVLVTAQTRSEEQSTQIKVCILINMDYEVDD